MHSKTLLRGLSLALLALCGQRAHATQATLVADTHVNAALPAVNSGAVSNVNVGAGYTGLIQFDLTTLPSGTTAAQITSATLRLYANRVDTPGTLAITPVTSTWSEYGVTFSTLPTLGTTSQTAAVSQQGAFLPVDVTAFVRAWISAPTTNFGLALTAPSASAQFDSKENDLTAHPAMLDITLASQGPTGATGATGPQGPAGATGATGPAGPQGLQGLAGATGAAGPAGAQGVAGVAGAKGATGATGATGPAGATGAIGPQGATGAAGPAGSAGPQGLQGLPGLGFEGTYASTTNYGLDDVVSWQGSSYISLQPSNHGNTPSFSPTWWALLAAEGVGTTGATGAQGPAGATGPQGTTGPAGPQGPTGTTGATGIQGLPGLVYQGAYASTTNYALGDVVLWQGASYASLTGSNHGNTPSFSPAQWGVLTAQGPTGATGAQGAQGVAGPTGALGPVGPPGEKGDQGAQGIAGQAGAQGIPGTTGATGIQGQAGPQGVAGPAGLAFQGVYSSTTNYALADGVSYNGSSYVSLIAGNHGNTPDQSPSQWALFAAAGAPGITGPQGAAGPIGPAGPQGSQGVAGATGTTGPTGPQGPAVVNYTGNYSSINSYAIADAVSYGGSTYVSLSAANHGNTPSLSPSQWAVLAAQGAAGAQGATGSTGPAGAAGTAGATGATGPQGPPVSFAGGWLSGHAYNLGDAVSYAGASYIALAANTGREPDVSPTVWGVLAQVGAVGPTGATGPTGLQGPTGYPGPQGVAGPIGPTGATGIIGPAGTIGATGPAGPAGPQGATGIAGLAYQGTYNSAINYALNDAVTFQGSTYISLAAANAGNIPGSAPASWALLAAQGAAGAPGLAGTNGSNGATGPAGPTGATGAQGPAGVAGANGSPGLVFQGTYASATNYALNDAVTLNGATYLSLLAANRGNTPGQSPTSWALLAAAGATGATGIQGLTGATGATGATGTQGAQGPSGPIGAAGINFRGPWTSGTGYALNDAVTFNGTTYLAQLANASVEPDTNASAWAVLAAAGAAGPTGAAASVSIGTVTTGAPSAQAQVTNSGTSTAAILNFVIPQGATGATGPGGTGGTGGASTSGIPYAAMYHAVSYAAAFYAVNNTNQSANETASVLTWVPQGCTATRLDVYSQQGATITVTLRTGTPGSMTNSTLACSASTNTSCSATGSVTVTAGSFVDIGITHPDSNPVGVWTALSCN